MLRTVPVALLALVFALPACTGGAPAGPTVEKLEEAKGLVRAMQPKADAMAALEGALGAPTKTDDEGASWFAKDGERCKELRVQLMGDMVGNINLSSADCPG